MFQITIMRVVYHLLQEPIVIMVVMVMFKKIWLKILRKEMH